MFGYVRIAKNYLSQNEYDAYKGYYCGLCSAAGKCSCAFSRISLSYEAVFLFMLLSSLQEDEPAETQYKCILHPLTKINIAGYNNISRYCVHMNIMMTYLKIRDNISDDKNFRAYAAELLFRHNYKKSCAAYPDISKKLLECLGRLHTLEQQKCADPDLCADCFACMLAYIFCPEFITDHSSRRILYSIGYDLGRWIYLIDAADDIEDDYKKGNYNPFLCKYQEYLNNYNNDMIGSFASYVFKQEENLMTYTLSSLSSAFELLDIKRNRAVLENIIYPGLKNIQDRIKVKNEKK